MAAFPALYFAIVQAGFRGYDLPPEKGISAYSVGLLIVDEGQERKVKFFMKMEVVWLSPDELTPYPGNAKMHPPEQVEHIANSIKAFGWKQPIVVDRDKVVIIGHGRLAAAKELLLDSVPVVFADDLDADQVKALRLADNKTNESGWNFSQLEEELAALSIAGLDMVQFGFEELSESIGAGTSGESLSMKDKYLVPPFSIIYGNKPDWLARKRAWVSFGIRSELGRGGDLLSLADAIGRQANLKG